MSIKSSQNAKEPAAQHCTPCKAGAPALSAAESDRRLKSLSGWSRDGKTIHKTWKFKNYYETMAFVNALAWISHREDHHPDLAVGYNRCKVTYSTHAVDGLSENDFICAAIVEGLDAK